MANISERVEQFFRGFLQQRKGTRNSRKKVGSMTYMLDTNICIYAIKNKPRHVLQKLREVLPQGVCISAVTLAELEHGVAKNTYPERNKFALMHFLSILEVLPFDDMAAVEYGDIFAVLQKLGRPIGTMDALIAAHARAENLILVTNNMREFERVPNLQIENWVDQTNSPSEIS